MYFEDDIFTFLAKNDMDLRMKGTGALEKTYNNRLFKEAIEDSGCSPHHVANILEAQFGYYKSKFPFKADKQGYEMHLHTLGMIRRIENDDFGLGKPQRKDVASCDLLNNRLESEISFFARKFNEAEDNNEPAYYQNYIMGLFNDALNFYPCTPAELKDSVIKEFQKIRTNNKHDKDFLSQCKTCVTLIGMLDRSEHYEKKVDPREEVEFDEVIDDVLDEEFENEYDEEFEDEFEDDEYYDEEYEDDEYIDDEDENYDDFSDNM